MKGKPVTTEQIKMYMQYRDEGDTQKIAGAKSKISLRSAKRVEKKTKMQTLITKPQSKNHADPLKEVWTDLLVPILERTPNIQAKTLLDELQNHFPNKYPDNILRTLQRRVKEWKALYGPEKEVIFRQEHPPGLQGISDFTNCNNLKITIQKNFFPHLLYHFALAFSKWEYAKVISGGESFPALAEGLQSALRELGGAPKTHRTDSLFSSL